MEQLEAGASGRTEEEQRWRAVLARDPQADGSFYYAVRSTGIYCRPSCPSRKPAREQVFFFLLPEAAEQAGYRPCRRCSPRGTAPLDPRGKLVQQACRLLEAPEPPSLAQLAARLGLSPAAFGRLFRRLVGVSPRRYAAAGRLGR